MRKLMESISNEVYEEELTNKGRPLRRRFSGLMYFPTDEVRIVQLNTRKEVIVPWEKAEEMLGKKAPTVMSEVQMNGFFENKEYRIEIWEDPAYDDRYDDDPKDPEYFDTHKEPDW